MTELKCKYKECPNNFNGECSNPCIVISVSGECEKAKEIDSRKTTLVYPKER